MADQATIYPGYTDAEATAPPVGRPPAFAYDHAERTKALVAQVGGIQDVIDDAPWEV